MAKRLKPFTNLLLSTLIALAAFNGKGFANEFGARVGYFNLKAKTSTGDATLSNIGLYSFSYSMHINDHLEFKPGYALYILGTSNIDLGYGPDIAISYYPISFNRPMITSTPDLRLAIAETWRPYINLAFRQRQFQSIQSGYAGLGISLGSEMHWRNDLFFSGELGYTFLKGPLQSEINETTIVAGINKIVE